MFSSLYCFRRYSGSVATRGPASGTIRSADFRRYAACRASSSFCRRKGNKDSLNTCCESVTPPPLRTTPSYPRAHRYTPSYSFIPAFAHFSPKNPPYSRTPLPAANYSYTSIGVHLPTHSSEPTRPLLHSSALFSTDGTERCSHANKSLLARYSSGSSEVSEKSL